jgi:hypothetical protein
VGTVTKPILSGAFKYTSPSIGVHRLMFIVAWVFNDRCVRLLMTVDGIRLLWRPTNRFRLRSLVDRVSVVPGPRLWSILCKDNIQ